MRLSPHTARASQQAALVGRTGCVASYAKAMARNSRADMAGNSLLALEHSLLPTSLSRLSIGVPCRRSRLSGRFRLPVEDPDLTGELIQAKGGVTKFHPVDPMDDLGAHSTPVARSRPDGEVL